MNIFELIHLKEQYIFKGVYKKGKRGNEYRFLLEHISDGKFHKKGDLELFYISEHFVFGMDFTFIDVKSCKVISDKHMKFKNYNYYYVDNNIDTFIAELAKFKNGRKIFNTGRTGEFDQVYRPTFKLDSATF